MSSSLQQLKIDRSSTPSPRPRRTWLWVLLGGLLLLAVLVLWGRGRPQTVAMVSVVTVYPAQAMAVLNATGYVVAQRKASVATKATGRLEALEVREGDTVRSGQLLARLENGDVRAARAQAEASVAVARANRAQAQAELADAALAWSRARDLRRRNYVSQASLDAALARHAKAQAGLGAADAGVQQAQAALQAADVALESTLIRAPFAGVILQKHANVGDVVAPFASSTNSKAAVVTMADMATLEVEADVAESSLSKVQAGQACEILLDAIPGVRLLGSVKNIVPTVDRSKATVTVHVSFLEKHPRVLPDMSAKVLFLPRALQAGERQPQAGLDPAAITRRDGKDVVFVVADGIARQRPVQPGPKAGELQVLHSGPEVGAKVVLKPGASLRDGSKIVPASKP